MSHEQVTYYELKGIIESLLKELNLREITFSLPTEDSPILGLFSPNRVAEVQSRGEIIGLIGELHPQIQLNFGVDTPIAIAELDAELLYELTDSAQAYHLFTIIHL